MIKKFARKVKSKVMGFVKSVKDTYYAIKSRIYARMFKAVAGTAAEAYVDTGVKILIAVVVGALLLAGLYALFGDTIMPAVTEKVEELFNYAG